VTQQRKSGFLSAREVYAAHGAVKTRSGHLFVAGWQRPVSCVRLRRVPRMLFGVHGGVLLLSQNM